MIWRLKSNEDKKLCVFAIDQQKRPNVVHSVFLILFDFKSITPAIYPPNYGLHFPARKFYKKDLPLLKPLP